ncbi:MAG TPA: hypothetical protein VG710_01785 [Opitutus sp.]|nr:hypothetical protein [Opitutus sp.]
MLLAPWLVVALVVLKATRSAARVEAPVVTPSDGYVQHCRPGPWGDLQYTKILVEPPDEFISAQALEPEPIRWVFKGYTAERLHELWAAAGLSGAQIHELESPGRIETTPDAIIVKPSADFVLNLSTPARTRIYTVLSLFTENPNQNEPFRFNTDTVDEWFSNSDLDPSTIALVKRMIYRRGSSALFSDHDVVLPRLASSEDRLRLMTTLARKSTLLVKLRVSPSSDIPMLTRYWGHGARSKDIEPFLQSVSHNPKGTTIDIIHLLPRFARARLFTYPQPVDHPDDINHDCHWSAFNFLNDPPDERFADADFVKRSIEHDYAPVSGQPSFGDVLVLVRPNGEVIHSCVYIADDIVFTKNGASKVMPWILMKLSDVIAFYPADPPLTVQDFRRKDQY